MESNESYLWDTHAASYLLLRKYRNAVSHCSSSSRNWVPFHTWTHSEVRPSIIVHACGPSTHPLERKLARIQLPEHDLTRVH